MRHRGALPEEFTAIVLAKVTLLALMGWALWRAIEEFPNIRERAATEAPADFLAKSRLLLRWYETVIIAGTIALGLGLWLAGV